MNARRHRHWSTTYYGEHTTTVNGNGRDPGMKDVLAVGRVAGMPTKVCKQIAEEIREKMEGLERKYPCVEEGSTMKIPINIII